MNGWNAVCLCVCMSTVTVVTVQCAMQRGGENKHYGGKTPEPHLATMPVTRHGRGCSGAVLLLALSARPSTLSMVGL